MLWLGVVLAESSVDMLLLTLACAAAAAAHFVGGVSGSPKS